MDSILWNSSKKQKGLFSNDDSQKRTQNLAILMEDYRIDDLNLKTAIKRCGSTIDAKDTLNYNEKSSYKNYLISAAQTLQSNTRMLEYKFNQSGELETILVHSHVDLFDQFSVSKEEICEKACEVYVAIQLYIDSTYKDEQIRKPIVTLTDKLSNKCNFGNEEPTNVVDGGSRSRRRKRVRKNTRKPKTHRRRRHSRTRKHKKYTSRRR